MTYYKNENHQFYNSKAWISKRQDILRRDKYKCKLCERYMKNTDADVVHHIVEVNDDWSLRLNNKNLISLCHKHHNQIHKSGTITS